MYTNIIKNGYLLWYRPTGLSTYMYSNFHTYYFFLKLLLNKIHICNRKSTHSSRMREIKVMLLFLTLKAWVVIIIIDGRNFHLLRYEKVILAYT